MSQLDDATRGSILHCPQDATTSTHRASLGALVDIARLRHRVALARASPGSTPTNRASG